MRPLVTLLGLIILFLLAQVLWFYRGVYLLPASSAYAPLPEGLPLPPVQRHPDNPERGIGVLVLDLSHDNDFSPLELNSLLSRVTARGYTIEYLQVKEAKERLEALEKRLRYADVYAVIAPRDPFSQEEVNLLSAFVHKGGKLLLIADPTRRTQFTLNPQSRNEINTLASAFGFLFEDDYLYNLRENDGNFRNIFLADFREHPLTRDLKKIALYTAGSIRAASDGLVFTDSQTFSSLGQEPGRFAAAALTRGDRVLALGDATFLTEPFSALYDNERFISNIADFLAQSQRRFHLDDFPHFFRGPVRVVYSREGLLEGASKLRNTLVRAGKEATIGTFISLRDMLYLGLMEEADPVAPFLSRAGVTLGDKIDISIVGQLAREKTALLVLQRDGDRYVLAILGDAEETLKKALDKIESGSLGPLLLTESIGVVRPDSETPSRGLGELFTPTPTPRATPTATPTRAP